jgi:signal transduction histidine kinase
MSRSRDRSYQWVFYTTSGLLFAGSVLRAPLFIGDNRVLVPALLLLFVWLALFLTEPAITRRWGPWFHVYLVLQMAITVILLAEPETNDFFAVLFGILSMQVLERYPPRVGAACLIGFIPLMLVPLLFRYNEAEAVTLAIIYTAVNVILGAYIVATRSAARARAANQTLGGELVTANAELREYSSRLERLAVAQERSRVARDLHDSVTQTIFSMTLASQSAAILLDREPAKVGAQLDRLAELTRNALSEMHLLVTELAPDAFVEEGLVAALRHDAERRAADGLTVSVSIEAPDPGGASSQALSPAEEKALLRIAQEALNNVAKRSRADAATIRLSFDRPPTMEIEDRGQGFDPNSLRGGPGLGLTSMRERAAEIGWDLQVESSAAGTRVIARRKNGEGGGR